MKLCYLKTWSSIIYLSIYFSCECLILSQISFQFLASSATCALAQRRPAQRMNCKKDSSKELNCGSLFDRCMRVWVKNGDTTTVANSCSNESACKAAEDAKCDGKCAVGCCDTDLCNAGSPVSFSMFLTTVCCTLGLALMK